VQVWVDTANRWTLRDGTATAEQSADLVAVRNTWRGLQIHVRHSAAVTGLNVEVGDLVGADATITGHANKRLYRAAHIEVARSTFRQVIDPDTTPPGHYPDILIPSAHPVDGSALTPLADAYRAVPFDLPADQTHTFYVRYRFADTLPSGTYAGTITVTGDGQAAVEIPVEVEVLPVTLPTTPALPVYIGSPAQRLYSYRADLGWSLTTDQWDAVGDQVAALMAETGLAAIRYSQSDPPFYPSGSGDSWTVSTAAIEALQDWLDTYRPAFLTLSTPTYWHGLDVAELTIDPTGTDNAVDIRAIEWGADGEDITVEYLHPAPSTPLSVDVSGDAVTVNLATDAGGYVTTTAAEVAAAINADPAAGALIYADNAGYGVVAAEAAANLALPQPSATWSANVAAWCAAYTAALAEIDDSPLAAAIYHSDEPATAKQRADTIGVGSALIAGGLRSLVTTEPEAIYYGAVDVWVVPMENHDADDVAARQALRELCWSYEALSGSGNVDDFWHLDRPLLNYRIRAWRIWRAGYTGLLYWGGGCYWGEVLGAGHDPWQDPETYEIGDAGVFNGEGTLFYPADVCGYHGLVPSMRLMALADGVADFGLAALVADHGYNLAAQAIVDDVADDLGDYDPTTDPDDVADAWTALAALARSIRTVDRAGDTFQPGAAAAQAVQPGAVAADDYQPGAAAAKAHRPGPVAADSYRPGAIAAQAIPTT